MVLAQFRHRIDIAKRGRVKLFGEVLHGGVVVQRPAQAVFDPINFAGLDCREALPAGALGIGGEARAGGRRRDPLAGQHRVRPVQPG